MFVKYVKDELKILIIQNQFL